MIDEQKLFALIKRAVGEVLAERAAAKPQQIPGFVTVVAFADRHKLHPATVRSLVKAGRLPASRIGRSIRIPEDAEIAPQDPRKPLVLVKTRDVNDAALRILGGKGGAR